MTDALEYYTSVEPKCKELQKYIAYYYFDVSLKEKSLKKFIFYPHYRNALTVYRNSKMSFGDNSSYVSCCKEKLYEICYTGIHLKSRLGKIETPYDKIGVVFQPLGFNNFIEESLSKVIDKSPKSNLDCFGSPFNRVLDVVYEADTIESKVKALDAFFLNRCLLYTSPSPRDA